MMCTEDTFGELWSRLASDFSYIIANMIFVFFYSCSDYPENSHMSGRNLSVIIF